VKDLENPNNDEDQKKANSDDDGSEFVLDESDETATGGQNSGKKNWNRKEAEDLYSLIKE